VGGHWRCTKGVWVVGHPGPPLGPQLNWGQNSGGTPRVYVRAWTQLAHGRRNTFLRRNFVLHVRVPPCKDIEFLNRRPRGEKGGESRCLDKGFSFGPAAKKIVWGSTTTGHGVGERSSRLVNRERRNQATRHSTRKPGGRGGRGIDSKPSFNGWLEQEKPRRTRIATG